MPKEAAKEAVKEAPPPPKQKTVDMVKYLKERGIFDDFFARLEVAVKNQPKGGKMNRAQLNKLFSESMAANPGAAFAAISEVQKDFIDSVLMDLG